MKKCSSFDLLISTRLLDEPTQKHIKMNSASKAEPLSPTHDTGTPRTKTASMFSLKNIKSKLRGSIDGSRKDSVDSSARSSDIRESRTGSELGKTSTRESVVNYNAQTKPTMKDKMMLFLQPSKSYTNGFPPEMSPKASPTGSKEFFASSPKDPTSPSTEDSLFRKLMQSKSVPNMDSNQRSSPGISPQLSKEKIYSSKSIYDEIKQEPTKTISPSYQSTLPEFEFSDQPLFDQNELDALTNGLNRKQTNQQLQKVPTLKKKESKRKKRVTSVLESMRPAPETIISQLESFFPGIDQISVSAKNLDDLAGPVFIETNLRKSTSTTHSKLSTHSNNTSSENQVISPCSDSLHPYAFSDRTSDISCDSDASFVELAKKAIMANKCKSNSVRSSLYIRDTNSRHTSILPSARVTIKRASPTKGSPIKPLTNAVTSSISEEDENSPKSGSFPSEGSKILESSPLSKDPEEMSLQETECLDQYHSGNSNLTTSSVGQSPSYNSMGQSPVRNQLRSSKMIKRISILDTVTDSPSMDNFAKQLRQGLIEKVKNEPQGDLVSWFKGDAVARGAYGTVYVALNLHKWELMAVKQVEIAVFNRLNGNKGTNTIKTEMEILSQLSHPNIVKYLGFEEESDVVNLFLEYVCGGSIGSVLKKTGPFPNDLIRSMTKQSAAGLAYLHSNGVVHRDIKADNSRFI